MPRKIDPKNTIKPSTGLAGNDSIEANAFPDTDPNMAAGVGLEAHIDDPVNAHPASAIGYENDPVYFGDNVDDVLDELGGLVPPRPPTVGNWKTYLNFVGIPDWGVMKLDDDPLDPSLFVHQNFGSSVYPYYHNPPKRWADLAPNETNGADLVSDPIFNVADGAYTGGGQGASYGGAYQRGTDSIESHNAYKDGEDHIVLSGALFPADRGTFAIFYVPPESTVNDIECVAALNCGQGLEACDGETGGIWNYGVGDDPYQYPSAASGQYDLQELHTGYVRGTVASITLIEASADPSVANIHYSGTPSVVGGIGDKIFIQGSNSTPSVDGEYEIVGLGAGYYQVIETITVNGNSGRLGLPLEPSDFSPLYADDSSGQVREEYTILGGTLSSVAPNKGVDSRDDNNFFRYRLPYLENYNELIWTPVYQSYRYFKKPLVSLDPNVDLDLAGNYEAFNKDYWTFQLARYRHRFAIPNTGSKERGSFFVMHFKKEEYFENLLLDAVVPTEDQLYSANMADWSDIESLNNMLLDDGVVKPSGSYNILKSRLFADPDGEVAGITSQKYVLQRTVGNTYFVSGIQYFTPDGLGLNSVNVSVSDLFLNTWRTGDREISEGMAMPNPMHLHTGAFSRVYDTPSLVDGHGIDKGTRLEIPYSLLGAYDLTNAPSPSDVALYNPPTVPFANIATRGAFTTQATPMAFVRQPLRHKDTNYVIGHALTEDSEKNIMVIAHGSLSDTALSYDAVSDWYESFMDESYRWIWDLDVSGTPPAVPVEELTRILGAGLPTVGAIDIPVRVGVSVTWREASFKFKNRNLSSIAGTPEAQFAGLPHRNPPMQEGITTPNPQNGVLMYPQKNYGVGHRPSLAEGDIAGVQHDYSTESGDKVFIRAFDVAFSRAAIPLTEAIGSSFFKLRIYGLQLEDFAWSGGASAGGAGIAIFVKLAGLTTWMDIGRVDGSGASKQDAFADGAGCQVNDPTETRNGVDERTGVVYADVLIHTGTATLYENSEGEAPILVKVVLKDSAEGRALNFEQTPNDYMSTARGLVGIMLQQPE